MPYIHITSHQTGHTIFGGDFASLRACLEEAVVQDIDLTGADLRNAALTNANLDGARLQHAQFDGANLAGANLSECLLNGANFQGAELYNTCFAQSFLRGCDFRGGFFGATDIAGAHIAGALFSTASCFTLDFALVQDMHGCCFEAGDGLLCQMSRPPTVVRGQWGHVIVVMDHHVKVGPHVKPLPFGNFSGRSIANAS